MAPSSAISQKVTHFSNAIASSSLIGRRLAQFSSQPPLFGPRENPSPSIHCDRHARARECASVPSRRRRNLGSPSSPCHRRSFPPAPLAIEISPRERLGIGWRADHRRGTGEKSHLPATSTRASSSPLPTGKKGGPGGWREGSIGYAIVSWRFQLPPNRSRVHRSRESIHCRPPSLPPFAPPPRFRPLRNIALCYTCRRELDRHVRTVTARLVRMLAGPA